MHGVDSNGILVTRKKLKRKQLLLFISNLEPCLIGMEACGGAHYLAHKCTEFGHEPKLMAAKFVKPYVKSNKNDFLDAEAICEAVQRPNMRFVTPRSMDQQALGVLVKVREALVRRRNVVSNQVHGFMLEFGIEYPKGRKTVLRLREIMSLHEGELPASMVVLLYRLEEEFRSLYERATDIEDDMEAIVLADDRGRRLLEIPGVGLITAACLLSWVGDAKHFRSGRLDRASSETILNGRQDNITRYRQTRKHSLAL
ncbi:MAG: transposase [Cryomorphaceae bacterium]